jgi:hypothetical protein
MISFGFLAGIPWRWILDYNLVVKEAYNVNQQNG